MTAADTMLRYGQLDSTTGTLAAAFIDAGVGKGSRVGLLMPNGADRVGRG